MHRYEWVCTFVLGDDGADDWRSVRHISSRHAAQAPVYTLPFNIGSDLAVEQGLDLARA